MSGVKGRSGPRRSPVGQLKAALSNLEREAPDIVESLVILAKGDPIVCQYCGMETGISKPDKEAAIYCLDRVLGKPKLHVDIKEKLTLTAIEVRRYSEIADKARRDFLEGKVPELKEGVT